MEDEGSSGKSKRLKPCVDDNKATMVEDESVLEVSVEDTEMRTSNSEQVEIEIGAILEKINSFTQMVSELLDSGKSMLKEVTNEFEERMILIHKEQIEKWEEEIKELRMLDAENEESSALLLNAKYLLQNIHGDS